MAEADIPKVAQLEKEIFPDPWSEKVYRETFALTGVEYIVAFDGDTLAGAAGVRNIVGTGEITNVMVKEGYRNRGLAGQIMKELLAAGRRIGASEFTLEVRKSNLPAIKLYENIGFVCEGVRPLYYRHPDEDALIYWLRS